MNQFRKVFSDSQMESTIQKAEEDLEKIERKYHEATKNVELARQAWDGEFCRVNHRHPAERNAMIRGGFYLELRSNRADGINAAERNGKIYSNLQSTDANDR